MHDFFYRNDFYANFAPGGPLECDREVQKSDDLRSICFGVRDVLTGTPRFGFFNNIIVVLKALLL